MRFFFFANARSTFEKFSSKNASWSATSCFAVVLAVNSYVAGKRKPSIPRASFRNPAGILAFSVAAV